MAQYQESDFTWLPPNAPKPTQSGVSGKNMTNARTAAGLSQRELAEKAGVKVRQVQRWEKGISKPSAASLKRLDELFGRDWTNAPEP